MVDVVASSGWARPALACMDLCQMVIQALWAHKDSPLLQVPHFTQELVAKAASLGANTEHKSGEDEDEDEDEDESVRSVYDLLEMEDAPRQQLLSMPMSKLAQVAEFCNRYPSLEVQWGIMGSDGVLRRGATDEDEDEDDGDADEEDKPHTEFPMLEGSSSRLAVQIEREGDTSGLDEGAGIGAVIASQYPWPKSEHWWVVVVEPSANRLLAIKRITIGKRSSTKIEIDAPPGIGKHSCSLLLVCDSYAGCDLQYGFELNVMEHPGDGDSDDEGDPMQDDE